MNNQEFEIDLLKLAGVLWKKILVILLVALIGATVAFGYTFFFITPTYKATVSLYVNNSSFSVGASNFTISGAELSTSNRLVTTYIFVLRSRTTLEDVIAKAGLRYSAGGLSGMITATPVADTAAFNVTVTSTSPTEAELIANTIATVLPDRISEIVDGSSVRVVDYAIVPSARSSPSFTTNTLIGLAIGAVLAIGLIVLKFLIDERNDVVIHSADELRAMYPDITVLALIPDMRLSEKKGYYYSSYYAEGKKGGKVSNG